MSNVQACREAGETVAADLSQTSTVTGGIVTYAIEALTVIVRSPVGMIVRCPVGLAQDLLRRVRREFHKLAGLPVDDDHQAGRRGAGSLRRGFSLRLPAGDA